MKINRGVQNSLLWLQILVIFQYFGATYVLNTVVNKQILLNELQNLYYFNLMIYTHIAKGRDGLNHC